MPARFGVLPWITHASYVFPDGAGRRLETRSALAPVCATTSVPCEPLRANRRAAGSLTIESTPARCSVADPARSSEREGVPAPTPRPHAPPPGRGAGGGAEGGKPPFFSSHRGAPGACPSAGSG